MTFIAPIPSTPDYTFTPGFGTPGLYRTATIDKSYGSSEVTGTQGTSFGGLLAEKIGELNNLHQTSDTLAIKAVTGDLQDVHDYTIAANQAATATQLTVAVRNKAVEAFNEILRMQL